MNRAEFLLHHTGDRRKKVVNPLEKLASSVESAFVELQEQCRALQLRMQLVQEMLDEEEQGEPRAELLGHSKVWEPWCSLEGPRDGNRLSVRYQEISS